jgi:hypothetical protein
VFDDDDARHVGGRRMKDRPFREIHVRIHGMNQIFFTMIAWSLCCSIKETAASTTMHERDGSMDWWRLDAPPRDRFWCQTQKRHWWWHITRSKSQSSIMFHSQSVGSSILSRVLEAKIGRMQESDTVSFSPKRYHGAMYVWMEASCSLLRHLFCCVLLYH